ncbi:hypothetical protein J5N97_020173 [Dioscorea zingiberensis]|uniref:AP2/ERF domain-containing protein n=1 Tax=Dioscorea zingiberensis TaxID=325984 RepID=A0A9D5HD64_9LILI|nr:hypothetical protein J5N97_020173 [Dioscorea zingiberensis]
MRRSDEAESSSGAEKKYKGIRRRKWGKWVSEIRVPGTAQRLWLGSYATPEAAAMAHDTAVVLLRPSSSSSSTLNFPNEASTIASGVGNVSPGTVQRLASNRGMAVDAGLIVGLPESQRRLPEKKDEMFSESLFWGDEVVVHSVHDSELRIGFLSDGMS